ncbi:MAG: superoxide dismutase, Fe-Mn family [Candidatus Binataceae bacterium]|nr:superoxide dismutase, Fe-Mn family [Candidatus Binataceae bacterium]
MTYAMKPLACDATRIKGMSEKLIVSHYENNSGGAVQRLNAIAAQLGEIDFATAPIFLINGLKREELIATNSMVLHELFFASLGEKSAPEGDLREALIRDFGSVAEWTTEFSAMGKAQRGGSGWVFADLVAARPAARQSVGDGSYDDVGWRAADPRARHVRALLSHRLWRRRRRLCRRLHGRDQLAEARRCLRRGLKLAFGWKSVSAPRNPQRIVT